MLDTISYKPYGSQTSIDLRSQTIRSNPKAARGFQYSNNGRILYEGSKEISLDIAVVGYQNANSLVDTLMKNSHWGFGNLTINDWSLRCKCTGISNVLYDENGIVEMTATFYAPRLKWFKIGSPTTIGDSGVDVTLTKISNFRFDGTWDSGLTDGYFHITGDESYNIDLHCSSSATLSGHFLIDPSKKFVVINSVNAFSYVSNNKDPFKEFSPGTYHIAKSLGTQPVTVRIVEWSDMPEWNV